MSTVIEKLEDAGQRFEVLHHAPADTSVAEAIALHIPPEHVAKTILVRTGSRLVALVIPASRRLDMSLARKAVGDHHARLATEEELRHAHPEFELGAFPPMPSVYGTPVYIDPQLLERDFIVFAAGDRSESVRMQPADVFPEQETIVMPLTREASDEGWDEGWGE